MTIVRATGLNNFNACNYKYKYDTNNIDPKATYFGDIIHMYSRENKEMIDPLIEFYLSNIEGNIKTRHIIEGIRDKIIEYKNEFAKENNIIQEVKMIYPFNENLWIEGTSDVIYQNKKNKENGILDWKTSAMMSWYDDIFESSIQSDVYSFLLMKYMKIDKCKFTYVVFEKKTSNKVKEFSKDYILKEVENKIKKIISEYEYSTEFDEYKPIKNKLCVLCSLKKTTCPLYNS